jgi:hypothetical protein
MACWCELLRLPQVHDLVPISHELDFAHARQWWISIATTRYVMLEMDAQTRDFL